MIRSAAFLVQRFMLGRETLLARVPEFALEMRVPARDAAGRNLFRRGMHAPEVTNFLATRLELEPDDLVFDIGASVGWYSMLLASIAPRGASIHAFEPDPWMRGMLQENASRNRADAVTVVGAAVGEDSGPATLHRYGYRRRNRGGLLALNQAESIGVEMVSLDDYCRRQGLDKRPVGFIKIGVEGFEYFALRGAQETLGRCRALLTEFAPARLAQADVHPAGMLDLLVELGFVPAVLEADGPRPVERAELLADAQPRNLFWARPTRHVAAPPPDPNALAI
ncbi:MAG: FkbM family methyltransferase [Gammaproteobacteria bacterium]